MNKMKGILSRSGRGNGLMTEEFCQSIVRTAVRIANECDTHEILQYIRCEAWFTPAVKEIEIGKAAMSDYSWGIFM